MARSRASLAITEPEFDEAWADEGSLPARRTPHLSAAPVAAVPESAVPEPAANAVSRGTGVPGRRTVTIRGQVASRPAPRRAGRDPYDRMGARPDRIAKWAVLLCVLLVLVAATSSHAAVLHLALHARPLTAPGS